MLNIESVFKAKMLHYFSHTSRSITKSITSLSVSFNLVTDLVTFFSSVTKLSDKEGLTTTSKAVILSTLNSGSGLPSLARDSLHVEFHD